jgi:monoamine oxidase
MDPGAVQGLEAAFWTWTASGAAGGPATFASAFTGGARADAVLELADGSERWLAAVQMLRPELRPAGAAVLTRWADERYSGGSYGCHPPGWSRRDDEEAAAPHGRVHLAGEHTAAEFCGTFEGALRSGARAATEVLAERDRLANAH